MDRKDGMNEEQGEERDGKESRMRIENTYVCIYSVVF